MLIWHGEEEQCSETYIEISKISLDYQIVSWPELTSKHYQRYNLRICIISILFLIFLSKNNNTSWPSALGKISSFLFSRIQNIHEKCAIQMCMIVADIYLLSNYSSYFINTCLTVYPVINYINCINENNFSWELI